MRVHSQGAQQGVCTMVMRLPSHVFDRNGSIFSKIQAGKAQDKGVAMYFGNGELQLIIICLQLVYERTGANVIPA